MNKTLLDIVEDLVDEHGIDGAIDNIMTNEWPIDTKERAINMLEKRQLGNAMVEPGEYNRDEFFQ